MDDQKAPHRHTNLSEAVSLISDWVTASAFCRQFPNIPEKTLRWQLTNRHQNGLAPYVQVIGKQRFVSIRGYAKWLAGQAGTDVPIQHAIGGQE